MTIAIPTDFPPYAIEDMELTKNAPPTADVKRFEDNNAVSAFVAGQVQMLATGAAVAAT